MKNKGPLYVLTCYVIWGLLPIFWKLLAQVDSLYVLASRIVWSMVLTGGILLLRRGRRGIFCSSIDVFSFHSMARRAV